jgi:PAS domain-containing protein
MQGGPSMTEKDPTKEELMEKLEKTLKIIAELENSLPPHDQSSRPRHDHEYEKLYRLLRENMLNGFSFCEMIFEMGEPVDILFLEVNSAFESLTGLTDIVGKKASGVLPGIRETDPELFEIFGRVSSTGHPERADLYVNTLKQWFRLSVYSPETGFFIVVFDIVTELKKAEALLQKREKHHRVLFENMLKDRKSTRLNSSHRLTSRMPSSA